jgi:hypothetical protein
LMLLILMMMMMLCCEGLFAAMGRRGAADHCGWPWCYLLLVATYAPPFAVYKGSLALLACLLHGGPSAPTVVLTTYGPRAPSHGWWHGIGN